MSVLDDIIVGVLEDLKEREDRVPLSRVKEIEQSVPEAKDAPEMKKETTSKRRRRVASTGVIDAG